MPKKEHVSIRLKNEFNDKELNLSEWEELTELQYYFKKSIPYIVEAALAYNNNKNDFVPPNNCIYENEKICEPYIDNQNTIEFFMPYINLGCIHKDVEIKYKNSKIVIPKGFTDIKVKYFPPHIVSFETSIQTRVTIDLSKDMLIEDEEKLIIKYL